MDVALLLGVFGRWGSGKGGSVLESIRGALVGRFFVERRGGGRSGLGFSWGASSWVSGADS